MLIQTEIQCEVLRNGVSVRIIVPIERIVYGGETGAPTSAILGKPTVVEPAFDLEGEFVIFNKGDVLALREDERLMLEKLATDGNRASVAGREEDAE